MRAAFILFVAVSLAGMTGCHLLSDSERGTFSVNITDMPFPFEEADSANVVIERVELVGQSDSTDTIVLSEALQPFNLLDLRDGVTAPLASGEIPDGKYSQLRVIVNEDASVVLADGRTFDLQVASGSETGITINLPTINYDVSDNVEVTVDFNVEESFVVQGNPATVEEISGFTFEPVLHIDRFEINDLPIDGDE